MSPTDPLPPAPAPTPSEGLDDAQARARLARVGPNELQDAEHHGFARTLLDVAREPMFLLLLVAAGVYLVLGDLGEGLLLGAFAVLTVGLVIAQERRSERALDALRALAVPQVRVRRGGQVVRVPAREVVPGDLLLLSEGERVAADALLREASPGLAVDESLLTGESVPVRKQLARAGAALPSDAPGGDDSPFVFAGTLVTAGHGLAEVRATGPATRVGRIGASLAAIAPEATPLQRQLQRLVRGFGTLALVLCAVLVAWYGLARGDWLAGLLSGLALGMGMLPEEFPMALAVFLAIGAWRLAREQVLARRPAVIEALGAITMLCVDKTGTLTENRMRVRRLVGRADDGAEGEVVRAAGAALPPWARRLLEHGVLASRRDAADPMDRALVDAGDAAFAGGPGLHPDWRLEHEYPLGPGLLAMSHAWLDADGARHVAAKGAPEAIADLCHLDEAQAAAWRARVQALAAQGLRVLGVAVGTSAPGRPVDGPEAVLHDYDFAHLGLVAFQDPLRASVPGAMAQARAAGVQVAMITGDHAATALAVAREAGLDAAGGVLTGAEIEAMDDAALAAATRTVRVYARVAPEQKLRLVETFRAAGETVAMTGDGVNDAPALKAAHVGIAMGRRGTDVAREAAAIVLLDEQFDRIVAGVRMGRRIFDNLRKVLTYIMAVHLPIAGLALLPVLFGWPPLLLPVHVVITEMVIDPVCSLAFEGAPEARGLMARPPRRAAAGLVDRAMVARALVQGGAVLAAVMAVYAGALLQDLPDDAARAIGVIALTAGNLGLVVAEVVEGLGWRALLGREFRPLRVVAVVATAVLALGLAFEGPRRLLHFAVPPAEATAVAIAAVLAAIALATALVTATGTAVRRWNSGARA